MACRAGLCRFEQIRVTAGKNGDLALGGEVDAAGDRSLHGAHAFRCCKFCKALDFIAAQGGHFDPG